MITQIHKGQGKQPWFIRYRTSLNGEIINLSEGYLTKWNAKRQAKKNFPECDMLDDDGKVIWQPQQK